MSHQVGDYVPPQPYVTQVTTTTGPRTEFNLADPDPDRTFLGLMHRELMTATANEKEIRASLAEHQAKADHLTREREAIERAIKAYQQQDNRAAAADITAYVRREGDR